MSFYSPLFGNFLFTGQNGYVQNVENRCFRNSEKKKITLKMNKYAKNQRVVMINPNKMATEMYFVPLVIHLFSSRVNRSHTTKSCIKSGKSGETANIE